MIARLCCSASSFPCCCSCDRFRFDRVVAWVLLVFGAVLVPVCIVLWVLGVVCDSMPHPAADSFCYTLGLLTSNTAANSTTLLQL
jgi:hypothetical protein